MRDPARNQAPPVSGRTKREAHVDSEYNPRTPPTRVNNLLRCPSYQSSQSPKPDMQDSIVSHESQWALAKAEADQVVGG